MPKKTDVYLTRNYIHICCLRPTGLHFKENGGN